jgi:hypothetical protein
MAKSPERESEINEKLEKVMTFYERESSVVPENITLEEIQR